MRVHSNSRTRSIAAFVLCALSATACGGQASGEDGTSYEGDLGSAEQPIQNGTLVSEENSGFPKLVTSGGLCSSVLLNNSWALTANHCSAVAGNVLTMGSQQQTISRVVSAPGGVDAALVQVSSPFSMNGSTSGYWRLWEAKNPTSLIGQSVTCYARGRTTPDVVSDGLLRSGTGVIAAVGQNYMALNHPSGQVALLGDSGGGCLISTTIGPALVMGIAGAGAVGGTSYPTMGAAIGLLDRWLMETMYPNRDFICHGTECMTTKSQLANNSVMQTGWLPCKGRPFQWQASINFQTDGDFFEVNSVRYAGNGYVGSSSTLAGGTPLTMFEVTNGSLNSRGVNWLLAQCL